METAKEVVEQIFEELKAVLGPNDRLIVSMSVIDGHMYADLIDKRDEGRTAVGVEHVMNVLTNRITRGGNYAKKIE